MGLFDSIKDSLTGSETEDIWNTISEFDDVRTLTKNSYERPQLIYKHSNRCSVCFVSKGNLEAAADDLLAVANIHYLNVVKHRKASNQIADKFGAQHESPQILLIQDGEVIYHASHGDIDASKILAELS